MLETELCTQRIAAVLDMLRCLIRFGQNIFTDLVEYRV